MDRKRVFITGGAGFIGRALISHIQAQGLDWRFTIFSRDDHKHAQMLRDFPDVRCIRGDIAGPLEHLQAAMAGHDIVIHAGANKHVDLSEINVAETIRCNVFGSTQVAAAANAVGVGRVVGISTDKAAGPVNVYGASKFLMERAMLEANRWEGPIFTLARYGNVIGSTGSVVTVWRKQVAAGQSITVTDPAMTRFWLSAQQAVMLILEALVAPAGVIVVPLLPALRMSDLMRWFAPAWPSKTIGMRPGERLHETIITSMEAPRAEVKTVEMVHLWPNTSPLPTGPTLDGAYTSADPSRFLSKDEVEELLR